MPGSRLCRGLSGTSGGSWDRRGEPMNPPSPRAPPWRTEKALYVCYAPTLYFEAHHEGAAERFRLRHQQAAAGQLL